ncbi:hypothetical protein PT2222_180087 [Paraburkholderia tropica]
MLFRNQLCIRPLLLSLNNRDKEFDQFHFSKH